MREQRGERRVTGVLMGQERQRSALVTNLWQKEGGAVVKVHVALTVEAAPAVLQHVIHAEHVHGLVILEERGGSLTCTCPRLTLPTASPTGPVALKSGHSPVC